jgi:hypothetical protein
MQIFHEYSGQEYGQQISKNEHELEVEDKGGGILMEDGQVFNMKSIEVKMFGDRCHNPFKSKTFLQIQKKLEKKCLSSQMIGHLINSNSILF